MKGAGVQTLRETLSSSLDPLVGLRTFGEVMRRAAQLDWTETELISACKRKFGRCRQGVEVLKEQYRQLLDEQSNPPKNGIIKSGGESQKAESKSQMADGKAAPALVMVCAWCEPNRHGPGLTHGICRRHLQELRDELRMLTLASGTPIIKDNFGATAPQEPPKTELKAFDEPNHATTGQGSNH